MGSKKQNPLQAMWPFSSIWRLAEVFFNWKRFPWSSFFLRVSFFFSCTTSGFIFLAIMLISAINYPDPHATVTKRLISVFSVAFLHTALTSMAIMLLSALLTTPIGMMLDLLFG